MMTALGSALSSQFNRQVRRKLADTALLRTVAQHRAARLVRIQFPTSVQAIQRQRAEFCTFPGPAP
jgi:hypothetical protein